MIQDRRMDNEPFENSSFDVAYLISPGNKGKQMLFRKFDTFYTDVYRSFCEMLQNWCFVWWSCNTFK